MRATMSTQKNNPIKIKFQSGFSLWSFLFVGGVLILFLYIGAKLVPVYTSDGAIGKALKGAIEGVPLPELRKNSIKKSVNQKLNIDGIYNGPDLEQTLEVKKTKKGTIITIKYRKDIPLFYNIGMHLDFNHEEVR